MSKSNAEHQEGDVVIVRGDIVLYTDADPYRIDLRRCSSRRQIDEWVEHLSTKYWASAYMIDQFVRLASEHHRLPPSDAR